MEITFKELTKICRTCFSEEFLAPIADSSLQNNIPVFEILSNFIPPKDLANDSLPQQICSECINQLNIYHSFKNKCDKNEQLLKCYLEKCTAKTELFIDGDSEYGHNSQSTDDDLPLISSKIEKSKANRKRRVAEDNSKLDSTEETKLYICKQCNKSFSFRYKLQMHMRVHTKEKPFKCDKCDLSFSLNGNLKRHTMIHSGERPHVCKLCGKGFIQATSLQIHTEKRHNQAEQPLFTCAVCSRVFVREVAYNMHMKRHNPRKPEEQIPGPEEVKVEDTQKSGYKCNVCNKTFAKLVFLKRHEPRHGEKTFLCSDCGKGFVRKADLQSHLKVHTGEKPHKCSVCNKTFAHNGSLASHSLVHSGYKPYSCYVCSKYFTQLSHLKVHQRTHNGERPYSCPYCGKTFALKSNLTVHIRTHTGETPFVCSVCGRGFYDSSSMKKHKNSHLSLVESDVKEDVIKRETKQY